MTPDAAIILAFLAGVVWTALVAAGLRWLEDRGYAPWRVGVPAPLGAEPRSPGLYRPIVDEAPGAPPPESAFSPPRAAAARPPERPCICGHNRTAHSGSHLTCDACCAAGECCAKFARQPAPDRPLADVGYLEGRRRPR